MSFLPSNIKFLRKEKGLTQAQLADKLALNRSVIGAYEEGRADPRVKTLINICHYFSKSSEEMLNIDLSNGDRKKTYVKGEQLRILPVTVNKETNREGIPLVPLKAAAGYLDGYGDVDYIENLTQFDLPFGEIHLDRTYRMFQIQGESMLPIPSGAYVLAGYVMDWTSVKDGQCYILLTKDDGVVYKRVWNELEQSGSVLLKSDNPEFDPYYVEAESILEMWHAVGYFSFAIPDAGTYQPNLNEMANVISDLQKKIDAIK